MVSDLIDVAFHSWYLDPIKRWLSPFGLNAIRSIYLPSEPCDDKLFWLHTTYGIYTVKSGYQTLFSNLGSHSSSSSGGGVLPSSLWSAIWKMPCVPKIRHFLWRALVDALPVADNLFKRKVTTSPLCCVCHRHPENVSHLLIGCDWTGRIWFGLPASWRTFSSSVQPSFSDWISSIFQDQSWSSQDLLSCLASIATTAWFIWKERNEVYYKKKQPHAFSVLKNSLAAIQEFSKAQEFSPYQFPSLPLAPAHWKPPSPGTLKVNVDASFSSLSSAATAAIIRDSGGNLVFGQASSCVASSPAMAEALAIKRGIQLAYSISNGPIEVESDALHVVNQIHASPDLSFGLVRPILLDICSLASKHGATSFSAVPRDSNMAADWLAKFCRKGMCPVDWVARPPSPLSLLLAKDLNYRPP